MLDFEVLRNDSDGVLATANHLSKAGSFGALDTDTFNSTKASAVANNAPTDIAYNRYFLYFRGW